MSSSKPYDHRARDLTNADIIFTEKADDILIYFYKYIDDIDIK